MRVYVPPYVGEKVPSKEPQSPMEPEERLLRRRASAAPFKLVTIQCPHIHSHHSNITMSAEEILHILKIEDGRQYAAVESFVKDHLVSYITRRSCLVDLKDKKGSRVQAAGDAFTKCIAIALNLKRFVPQGMTDLNDYTSAHEIVEHYQKVHGTTTTGHTRDSLESVCVFYFKQRRYCWQILQHLLRVADDTRRTSEFHSMTRRLLLESSGSQLTLARLIEHTKSLYERCEAALQQDHKAHHDKCWEVLLPPPAPATTANLSSRAKEDLHDYVARKMIDFAASQKDVVFDELEQTLKTIILYLHASTIVTKDNLISLLNLCKTHKFGILFKNTVRADSPAASTREQYVYFLYLVIFVQMFFSSSEHCHPPPPHLEFAGEVLNILNNIQSELKSGGPTYMWEAVIFVYRIFLDFNYYLSHPSCRVQFVGHPVYQNAAVQTALSPIYQDGCSSAWTPLANVNGGSAKVLDFLVNLIGIGFAEQQYEAEKLMLRSHQQSLRALLACIVFQFTGPYGPSIHVDNIICLVEHLYIPKSADSKGSEAFWLEWGMQESLGVDIERIIPAAIQEFLGDGTAAGDVVGLVNAGAPIEYRLESPLCVLVRMLQDYSVKSWGINLSSMPQVHDNGGFLRLLVALTSQQEPGSLSVDAPIPADCILRILNKDVRFRSVVIEEDICNVNDSADSASGRYKLRRPPPPLPFQFASVENAVNTFLRPVYGEIMQIYPVDAATLWSKLFPSLAGKPPNAEYLVTDRDIGVALYFHDEQVRLGEAGWNEREIAGIVEKFKLKGAGEAAILKELPLVQEMIKIVNSVDDRSWDRRSVPFSALLKYAQHMGRAGFADPSVVNLAWRQQAQQRLRLLIGQKYEVLWDKKVCWWKLLLEAIANPRCDRVHGLQNKAAALKMLSTLLDLDKIETLLELGKQWNDLQLYYLLQVMALLFLHIFL